MIKLLSVSSWHQQAMNSTTQKLMKKAEAISYTVTQSKIHCYEVVSPCLNFTGHQMHLPPQFITENLEETLITHLVEKAVKIYMHSVPAGGIKEDIFTMSVSKPQNVAHHGHDSSSAAVGQTCSQP